MNISSAMKAAKAVVTSKSALALLHTQKQSPHLLFAAGVVGVVATSVAASKATLKLDAVLEEQNAEEGVAKDTFELGRLGKLKSEYSQKDLNHDLMILKVQRVRKIVRLYGPTLLLGTGTLAAFGGSHYILSKRYAGAVAAYTALNTSFLQYRERTRAVVGDDKELEIFNGRMVEQVEVLNEDGTTTTVTDIVKPDPGELYTFMFERGASTSWSPDPLYVEHFLRGQQNWFNDKLNAKGHVFLNEVLDAIGLPRTKAGAVTGWVKGNRDNYVSFGIFEGDIGGYADTVTDRDGGVKLNFNVDGNVLDLI